MTEQIQRNVAAIADLEKSVDAQRSLSTRVGAAIAGFVGTMTFVITHVVGIGAWVWVNRLNSRWQFDPYPWPVLILILAVEAIVLSAFVLMTQRHQTRVADRRSHLNLQISLMSEAEMTKVINTLRTISVHLGLPDESNDAAFQEMAKDTDVEHVAQMIEERLEEDAKPDKSSEQ